MLTQSTDTHPDIERVLISLIRKASPAQKLNQVRSLSQTVIQLSKRAIARANNNISKQEIELMFVSHHYGKDLAECLRQHLEKRKADRGKS